LQVRSLLKLTPQCHLVLRGDRARKQKRTLPRSCTCKSDRHGTGKEKRSCACRETCNKARRSHRLSGATRPSAIGNTILCTDFRPWKENHMHLHDLDMCQVSILVSWDYERTDCIKIVDRCSAAVTAAPLQDCVSHG